MKVCVQGLWHLGVVTSAALTSLDIEVIALDYDETTVQNLEGDILPVQEPGVVELLSKAKLRELIKYTFNPDDIRNCEIFWLTYDTPVDETDQADINFVFTQFSKSLPFINHDALIIISSQLPVGSTRKLIDLAKYSRPNNNFKFYVQPENLRLGKALESFMNSEGIVIGTESGARDEILADFLARLDVPIIWMGLESAEMTKHAINSFLASSITFMGEISEICEMVGANSREVEIGLRSDPRVGRKMYVSPGLGFAGGTLARDVKFLEEFQKNRKGILSSLIQSNNYNNNWLQRKFHEKFGMKKNLSIIFAGLTYTEGTNTLRRSEMLNFAISLSSQGHKIKYFEDQKIVLPETVKDKFGVLENIVSALNDADLIIIGRKMNWLLQNETIEQVFLSNAKLFDPAGFLYDYAVKNGKLSNYSTVGIKN